MEVRGTAIALSADVTRLTYFVVTGSEYEQYTPYLKAKRREGKRRRKCPSVHVAVQSQQLIDWSRIRRMYTQQMRVENG
jgi:hypothetical protein